MTACEHSVPESISAPRAFRNIRSVDVESKRRCTYWQRAANDFAFKSKLDKRQRSWDDAVEFWEAFFSSKSC